MEDMSNSTDAAGAVLGAYIEELEEALDRMLVRGFALAQAEDVVHLKELAAKAEEYGLAQAGRHLAGMVQQLEAYRAGDESALSACTAHFHHLTDYAVIMQHLLGAEELTAMAHMLQTHEQE